MKSLTAPAFHTGKDLFFRTEMHRLLASSMFFSCMMVAVRMFHTGSHVFIFMVWNLFLAYIPYALSTWLTARYVARHSDERLPRGLSLRSRHWARRPLLILLSLIWLLFIPNAFYILTDLYHLADGSRHGKVPEWFDLALILSFAWNGLLLGVLSVRHMEKLFIPQASGAGGWLFVYPIMVLNAFGIYTGRYLRYNSWDIVSDPLRLLTDILEILVHPFRYHYVWNMVLCFSILLTLIYRMIRGGSKALA
jgi:uncharacterized membrane protein